MIAVMDKVYTAQLQAGLGLIEETLLLLDLWHPSMDSAALARAALDSGRFASRSARRLRNLVSEGFGPRYLVDKGAPARLLKVLHPHLTRREFEQLLFLYTCRAHAILADFVREVYWPAYAAGRSTLDNQEAQLFVIRANQNGKTTTPWSESTIKRAAGYLTGCCADFGLLERGVRKERRILPYRLEPRVGALLAYELHFAGLGDNRLIAAPDWALFGLAPEDVLAELKQLALQGQLIVQTAGSVTQISWPFKTMDEVSNAVAQDNL